MLACGLQREALTHLFHVDEMLERNCSEGAVGRPTLSCAHVRLTVVRGQEWYGQGVYGSAGGQPGLAASDHGRAVCVRGGWRS